MRKVAFWLLASLTATAAAASEAWVLQFDGPIVEQAAQTCTVFRWRSELVLHNAGSSQATIRLLSVSNGGLAHAVPDLHVQPGKTVAGRMGALGWRPEGDSKLFVTHLDVPDGVIIALRSEPTSVEYPLPCSGGTSAGLRIHGASPLPVVRALVPAGVPQHFLSADLGHLPNRGYATIYNAGSEAATATIQVSRECDEVVTGSQIVSIPADTVVSVGLQGNYDACRYSWPVGRHVVITLDQPGFALISSVNGEVVKEVSMAIAEGQTP